MAQYLMNKCPLEQSFNLLSEFVAWNEHFALKCPSYRMCAKCIAHHYQDGIL